MVKNWSQWQISVTIQLLKCIVLPVNSFTFFFRSLYLKWHVFCLIVFSFSYHGGPWGFLRLQEWNLQTYRCQLPQIAAVPQTCNSLRQDNRVRHVFPTALRNLSSSVIESIKCPQQHPTANFIHQKHCQLLVFPSTVWNNLIGGTEHTFQTCFCCWQTKHLVDWPWSSAPRHTPLEPAVWWHSSYYFESNIAFVHCWMLNGSRFYPRLD